MCPFEKYVLEPNTSSLGLKLRWTPINHDTRASVGTQRMKWQLNVYYSWEIAHWCHSAEADVIDYLLQKSRASAHRRQCRLPTSSLFQSSQTASSEVSRTRGPLRHVKPQCSRLIRIIVEETGSTRLSLFPKTSDLSSQLLVTMGCEMEIQPSGACILGALWEWYKTQPFS